MWRTVSETWAPSITITKYDMSHPAPCVVIKHCMRAIRISSMHECFNGLCSLKVRLPSSKLVNILPCYHKNLATVRWSHLVARKVWIADEELWWSQWIWGLQLANVETWVCFLGHVHREIINSNWITTSTAWAGEIERETERTRFRGFSHDFQTHQMEFQPSTVIYIYMEVSWNMGILKSSIYRLIFPYKQTILEYPHLWNPPYV